MLGLLVGLVFGIAFGIVIFKASATTRSYMPEGVVRSPSIVDGLGTWVKITHVPVKMIDLETPRGQDRIGLLEVEFENHAGETLTAFVNFAALPEDISPTFVEWKVGDSVRIVEVPMLISGHELVRTFIIVDWHQKEQSK